MFSEFYDILYDVRGQVLNDTDKIIFEHDCKLLAGNEFSVNEILNMVGRFTIEENMSLNVALLTTRIAIMFIRKARYR